MQNTSQLKKILIAVSVVVVLLIVAYEVFNALTFRVVGTDPALDNVATVAPFLKINFNRELSSSNLKLSATKDTMLSYKISGKTLDITLNPPLDQTKTYSIYLTNIQAADGKITAGKTFSFKPKYLTEAQLSADQRAAILQKQTNYNQTLNDGLIRLLPFTGGGLEFKVDYTVTYQNSQPHIKIIVTAPTAQGQQDAINWIKAVGFDPNNYNIQKVTSSVK